VIQRVAELGFHVFGHPPGADAPRVERLSYLRRFYLWPLPLSLPVLVFALAAAWGSAWLVVIGVAAVLWVQGFASLGRQIRRERAAGAVPQA
jgi:hypothetical protein